MDGDLWEQSFIAAEPGMWVWILLCMECVCGVSNSDPIVPCMKEFWCEKVFLFAIRQADLVYITKDRLYVANHDISACCYCLTWL